MAAMALLSSILENIDASMLKIFSGARFSDEETDTSNARTYNNIGTRTDYDSCVVKRPEALNILATKPT